MRSPDDSVPVPDGEWPFRRLATVLVIAALALCPRPAGAQTESETIGPGLRLEDGIVATRHSVTLGGETLDYVARAGRIPIRGNDAGETLGHMFFVSYSLEEEADDPGRPITFLWNGGPGSSSSLVHLLGFGPKRLDPDGAPHANDGTWLGSTDLVFVDPIGTGYSRPASAAHGAVFYQDRGDAESVAELIRVYLTRADAWDRPLFLAGESFGVLRASRVADVLQRQGLPVAGMMLIGLVPPLADISAGMRTALATPTYAAAAHFHGRLDPDVGRDFEETLRATEMWARDTYAPALGRRGRLTAAERIAVSARLTDLAGLPEGTVDSTLVVGIGTFAVSLLRDRGLVVGRYDSRLTGPLPGGEDPYDPTRDPSLMDIIDDVGVVRYMRDELGYRSDLRYQGPFGGGYPSARTFRGDWMSVRWDRSEEARAPVDDPTMDPTPAVQRVMRANEDLRVYVACGYFDLVCPYATIPYMVDAMDRELAARVSVHAYRGGHAIYTDGEARLSMRSDIEAFIRSVAARRP